MSGSVTKTFAPAGGAHMPSMPPLSPTTPTEIPMAFIEAAEAGASIIHPTPVIGKQAGRARDIQPFPADHHAIHRCGGRYFEPRRPGCTKGSGSGSAMPVHAPDTRAAVPHVTVAR